MLDDVLDASHDLEKRIGAADKAKLDEYLTNVREVERRTQVAEKWLDQPTPAAPAGPGQPNFLKEPILAIAPAGVALSGPARLSAHSRSSSPGRPHAPPTGPSG